MRENSGKCPIIFRGISGRFWEISSKLPGYNFWIFDKPYFHIFGQFPGNVRENLGKNPIRFRGISGRFREISSKLSRFFWIFDKPYFHIFGQFPGNVRENIGKIPIMFRGISGRFREISSKLPVFFLDFRQALFPHFWAVSGKCAGKFREMSDNFSRNFREIPENFQQTSRMFFWIFDKPYFRILECPKRAFRLRLGRIFLEKIFVFFTIKNLQLVYAPL